MTLEAQRLADDGIGDGIAALLLPKSKEERISVAKIAEIYTVERVKVRSGVKSGRGDRKALKAAIGNDELFAKLVSLYSEHIGNEPGPQTKSVKAFTRWFKAELQRQGSPGYRVVRSLAPVLLEVERGDSWWASAIAERRKRRVKDS